MPGSAPAGKPFIRSIIKALNPKTVLDVGVGSGTYVNLMRTNTAHDCVWTGVEVWQPYVEKFGLDRLYDELAIADIRHWALPKRYDLGIVGDVLEHMTAAEAVEVLKKIRDNCDVVIASLPVKHWPQGVHEGNPFEEHIKDDWSHEEVLQTFGIPTQQHVEDGIGVYVYDQRKQPTIFVNIAAYKDDKELWGTLVDAVAKAKHPERIRFAVIDQTLEPIPDEKLALLTPAQVEYLYLHYRYGRGPCWARAVGYTYLHAEDYVLQIDSHMRFDPEWDEWFVQNIKILQLQTDKPYISSLPHSYDAGDRPFLTRNNMVTVTATPTNKGSLKPNDPTIPFTGIPHNHKKTAPGCNIAAGVVFAPAELFRQVLVDPALYFYGEEQNFTIRAYTHGWDLFHVAGQPVYHLYNNQECTIRSPHWNKDDEEKRKQRWWEHHDRTLKRLVRLLYEKKDLGAYSLGSVRTLRDFAAQFGIDYENKIVTVGMHPEPTPET
jgi:glycosyltransferase involved in cell wall biosynthesis